MSKEVELWILGEGLGSRPKPDGLSFGEWGVWLEEIRQTGREWRALNVSRRLIRHVSTEWHGTSQVCFEHSLVQVTHEEACRSKNFKANF